MHTHTPTHTDARLSLPLLRTSTINSSMHADTFTAHTHTHPAPHQNTAQVRGRHPESPQTCRVELQHFQLASPTLGLTFSSPPQRLGQALVLGSAIPQCPIPLLPMEDRLCHLSILKEGSWVSGRGRIWEGVSQPKAKRPWGCGWAWARRIFQKGRRPWVMW